LYIQYIFLEIILSVLVVISVPRMAMLPHGTMLALTNNNVPAVQLVTIPWNVYGTGCETGGTVF
jgi:hypothetical protein